MRSDGALNQVDANALAKLRVEGPHVLRHVSHALRCADMVSFGYVTRREVARDVGGGVVRCNWEYTLTPHGLSILQAYEKANSPKAKAPSRARIG